MTDPGLPAGAAAAAIEATVTKQAHLQKLAWLLHDKPELLTGDGAKAPFPVVLRLIDALCEAGATRIRRPACPRCQRVISLGRQRDGLRICRNCCARARAVPCAKCGTTREPAARDGQGRPLCPYCLVTDPVNLEECVRCRRRRQVSTRTPAGPVCATCNPRGIMACSSCGRTAPCAVSKLTGQPRCGACARSLAQCSRCGKLATARAGTRDAPLCGNCAVPDLGLLKTCPGCGSPGRLIAGACRRCHLRQRLDELLADSAGNVRPELQALHQTLAAADRPAARPGLALQRHPADYAHRTRRRPAPAHPCRARRNAREQAADPPAQRPGRHRSTARPRRAPHPARTLDHAGRRRPG